ncbi:MAG: hypothetical protein ACYTEQ_24925 [Planctomycetota bacterium]|jgi:hypothetical protein
MRNIIKRNDSSFSLTSPMPNEWKADPSTVNAIITDTDGAELLASTAATLYAGDTLASAVTDYGFEIVLTTGTAIPTGSPIRITGSGDGYEDHIVEQYDSATKTVTLEERLGREFSAGAAVKGRYMTLSGLDTTAAAWENVEECTIEWIADTDDPNWPDEWTVLDRLRQSGDLANRFKRLYHRYWELIETDAFPEYREIALDELKLSLDVQGQNISKVISAGKLDPLIMVTIAAQIALGMSDRFEGELDNLKDKQNDLLAKYMQTRTWTDDNQDKVLDEGEDEQGQSFFGRQF